MKIDINKKLFTLRDGNDEIIEISNATIYPYSTLTRVLGYRDYNLESSRLIISQKTLDDNYEPVDNFFFVEFSKVLGKMIGYHQLYKSKKHDYILLIDKDLNEHYDGDEEVYHNDFYKLYNVYYKTDNSEESIKTIDEINKLCQINLNSSSKISIVLKTMSGFKFKEHKIKPLSVNVDTMYNDTFKPVHETIVNKLKEGSKGVIMLHGKAGTGKTNYIKHLTNLVPKKRFVFITTTMIPYLSDPSFLGELIENKGSVLVLEDCENYLKDRDVVGANNVVSTILNLSDGILSDVLGLQIICTFNTNLKNVDKALLRKGRLIAEYEFDELSSDKTLNLLKSLNFEHDLENQKSMVLTDIFNSKENVHRNTKDTKKIGF